MNELFQQYKQQIAGGLVALVLIGLGVLIFNEFGLLKRMDAVERQSVQNANNIQQIINYLNQQIANQKK